MTTHYLQLTPSLWRSKTMLGPATGTHSWLLVGVEAFRVMASVTWTQYTGVCTPKFIQSFSCWNQTWYHQFTGTSLVTTHGRSWTQDWKIPRVHYPSWWLETCVNNKNKWQFIKKTNKIQLENENISVIRAPEIIIFNSSMREIKEAYSHTI